MQSISFENGVKEYAINGDESNVIRINAADLNLGLRIEKIYPRVEELKKKYGDTADAQQLAELDGDIRNIIDGAFGADICSHAFGEVNCCSPCGGGKMLFENFLEAFLPVITEDIKSRSDGLRLRPQVQKYLDEKPTIPDISGLTTEQRQALIRQLSQ